MKLEFVAIPEHTRIVPAKIIQEEWEQTNINCIFCGKQTVVVEVDPTDLDKDRIGCSQCFCYTCSGQFDLGFRSDATSITSLNRAEAIRSYLNANKT